MTLSQFIAKKTGQGKRHAKLVLEHGKVSLNRADTTDGSIPVGKFDRITVAGETLQQNTPRYILLHKPAGILSATSDPVHETVIDLIRVPWADGLHLAGRLDRSTTGLVILTNDGRFSESLTRPEGRIPKTYTVTTDLPITEEALREFRSGMSFRKENIRTQPAIVTLLSENGCRLTIFEGKRHQIKRMFLRFGICVTRLHRESVGSYDLSKIPQPGDWMSFSPDHREPSRDLPPQPNHSWNSPRTV